MKKGKTKKKYNSSYTALLENYYSLKQLTDKFKTDKLDNFVCLGKIMWLDSNGSILYLQKDCNKHLPSKVENIWRG